MILKYLECVWHFVGPFGAAWTASCSCWSNPSCGLYKMGTKVKKGSPKKNPKISSIKWGPLLSVNIAQNTKKGLCKSQEKKTFYRGIKWRVIRGPVLPYSIEEISRGVMCVCVRVRTPQWFCGFCLRTWVLICCFRGLYFIRFFLGHPYPYPFEDTRFGPEAEWSLAPPRHRLSFSQAWRVKSLVSCIVRKNTMEEVMLPTISTVMKLNSYKPDCNSYN